MRWPWVRRRRFELLRDLLDRDRARYERIRIEQDRANDKELRKIEKEHRELQNLFYEMTKGRLMVTPKPD